MRNPKITTLIVAGILGVTSFAATAQPQPPRGGHGPAPHYQPGPAAHQPPHVAPRPHGPAVGAPPQAHRPGHPSRMGAGPDHKWVKGSRIPPQYRTPHYVVKDWQRHGLKRPGRGQQWVQNGSDYLLVAIASGVIAQVVFGH